MTQSHTIALQHHTWAKSQGQGNREIMRTIGLPSKSDPGDRLTINAIERTWLALQAGWSYARPER